MLTREIVDELAERFKGWGADGPHGVLRYLDQAHYILMTQESHQTLVYDNETGELPRLETEAGKRVYLLKEYPQIWRVGGVLLRNTAGGLPGKEVRITGEFYWQLDGVRTRDWLSHDDPATVTFTFDPGADDRAYYLRAWRRPKILSSVKIAHAVPPPNDALYLLPAAAKLIEGVQNGEVVESRLWIEKELKPKFWAAMNKGEQSEYIEPLDRGF
jgi:hypothetical protein